MTDAQRLAWPVPLGIRFGDVAKTKCSFCIHVTPRPLFQVCPTPFSGLLKAAGTGITLHAADYVFLLDPWWNPAVEAQAVDRVHRLGQKSTVFVYRMVTAGTIEERIEALKASKKHLFDQVVGDGEGAAFDVTQHFVSLRDLVQLTGPQEDSELIS